MKHWLLIMLVLQPVAAFADDAGAREPAVVQAVAGPNAPEPEIPVSEPPELLKDGAEFDLGWSLVRTFVVLGVVVALAWLTLNVGLRKLMGIGPAAGRRGIISVLERVPLDQKRTLYVVKAGDEVLLLGASDLSVNFLSKLDAKVVEEAAKPAGQVTLSPFLQKLLGKKEAPPPPPAT
ncbi:MAG: flagellar biosynthetic protein FliO [Archangium sp.]|nr:flagellar biosynthetic protein FliO [Archangium sp.]